MLIQMLPAQFTAEKCTARGRHNIEYKLPQDDASMDRFNFPPNDRTIQNNEYSL